jgi:hypothetical protein
MSRASRGSYGNSGGAVGLSFSVPRHSSQRPRSSPADASSSIVRPDSLGRFARLFLLLNVGMVAAIAVCCFCAYSHAAGSTQSRSGGASPIVDGAYTTSKCLMVLFHVIATWQLSSRFPLPRTFMWYGLLGAVNIFVQLLVCSSLCDASSAKQQVLIHKTVVYQSLWLVFACALIAFMWLHRLFRSQS